MTTNKSGMPQLPDKVPSSDVTFENMSYGDLWTESKMTSVCHWLRGGKYLRIPVTFRELLPRRL